MPSDLDSDTSSNGGSELSSEGEARNSPQPPPPFDYNQCLSALKGEVVPDDLTSITARCAVVRGIRCHYNFATSPAVAALRIPEIIRARNARNIMSDVIPDEMENPDVQPYCIWHPDIAKEETYRQLVRRYPTMRYQVGRACAAAGYADLYHELGLLPDVSIAEEARESDTAGGRQIFNTIMASPIKYAILDDFERRVLTEVTPTKPAFLNGDTAVRWMLESRMPLTERQETHVIEPDIEEDCGLGIDLSVAPEWRETLTPEETQLLYQPLPLDLPMLKKDLLVQMAAYEGNVDRYSRLMNPRMMGWTEVLCVIRGIYHNTMFARWWADQLETNLRRVKVPVYDPNDVVWRLKTAINARRVMLNDIRGLTDDEPHLPYLIWWPLKPRQSCLVELAQQCPKMIQQIAIACILCNYESVYRNLSGVKPHWHLWLAAKRSPNPVYLADLEQRAREIGVDITQGRRDWDGKTDCLDEDLEPTVQYTIAPLQASLVDETGALYGAYFGEMPHSGAVERAVWLSPDILRKIEKLCDGFIEGDVQWLERETCD